MFGNQVRCCASVWVFCIALQYGPSAWIFCSSLQLGSSALVSFPCWCLQHLQLLQPASYRVSIWRIAIDCGILTMDSTRWMIPGRRYSADGLYGVIWRSPSVCAVVYTCARAFSVSASHLPYSLNMAPASAAHKRDDLMKKSSLQN